MIILAPEVVGPISVCSKNIRIRNTIAGATVTVRVNGADTATHTGKFSDANYALGVTLAANDVVTATQSLGADTSAASLPVATQSAPTQLSALTLHTQMFACGRRLFVSGGAPGAAVQGLIGAQVVGSGEIVAGVTAFNFNPVLQTGQALSLKQTTCNNLTQSQNTPVAVAQPSPLAKPIIQEPLIECMTSISISGVNDGAFVEMYRNGVLEKTFSFAVASEWRAIKALKKNDVIEVRQGFKCKKDSPTLESFSGKSKAVVQAVDALKAPKFVGIPCPGTKFVTLTNLIPGVRVLLTLNDSELGQTDAAGVTQTFPVSALPAGGVLKAQMSLCDIKGPSGSVIVDTDTQSAQDIKPSDLYQCAAYVFVKMSGGPGNYLINISNKDGQPISAYHNLVGIEKLIPVSPSLVAGQEITINVLACGGDWKQFGPFQVSAGTPPPAPLNKPIVAGSKHVSVLSKHAGAWVDVYVNNQWKGATVSCGNLGATIVSLPTPLKTGDAVFATQTLCGITGKPSETVKVVKDRPLVPVLLKPNNNATGVARQPLLEWQDPGANLENAAESYQVEIKQGITVVLDTNVSAATQLQSATMLQYETPYQWTVQAKNSTGNSVKAAPFTFKTRTEPPPAQADLHFVPPIISTPPGFPRGQPFNVRFEVINSGNAASGEFTVGVSLSLSAVGGELIDYVESTFASLDGGQSILLDASPVTITTTSSIRITAQLFVNGSEVDSEFVID